MSNIRVLFLVNIPSPYRVEFFNELGKHVDLTVLFENQNASNRDDGWVNYKFENFKGVLLNGIHVTSEQFLCLNVMKYLRQKWDFIILGGYSSPTAMLSIECLRIRRIPFYLEVDGGLISEDSKFKYRIKKHFIKSAKGWLSTGNATNAYLSHYGADIDKCFIYPFSSLRKKDLEFACETVDRSSIKNRLNIPDCKVILYVGRILKWKGIDTLIKSSKGIDNCIVFIIGGRETKEYREIINDYHIDNIFFIPFLSKEELSDYYRIADLFVLPSRGDIWGLVINEAMSYGIPIVTTDKCVAGLTLIENGINGYVVKTDDVSSMHHAMCNILENKMLAEDMSRNNKNKMTRYTIEEMVNAHLDFISKESKVNE